MAPGRLLQNGRRRAEPSSASGSARPRAAAASDELPPYEPPSQPLNDAARRTLAQISNNRSTRKYDQHLKKSTELIRDAVAAINDRAIENHALLQQQLGKLAQTGEDKPDDLVDLERYAADYGESVSTVTTQLESAMRDIIDYRVEMEDEPEVLRMVQSELESQAQTWRESAQPVRKAKKKAPREPAGGDEDEAMADEEQEEEEDDEEDGAPEARPPVPAVNEVLEKVRQSKADEWTSMDMARRYASNNDYIQFKRMLHDAQHPDDGVMLSHASTWFGEDGLPVLSKVGEGEVAADEEDDELQVAGEVLTFRCPLTMQVMKEPYSSDKCKHSFERQAITEYLGNGREAKMCPQSGCNEILALKNLHLDKLLQRRIQRQEQAQRAREDEDEEEDADGEGDTIIMSSKPVKAERRRSRVEEIDDDE